ncbi:MAG: FG-GAP-like repeat-containing protein [Bacteroidota bacterium]
MQSANFSYRLYRLTLGKYLKFKKRLDKSLQSGEFHKYNARKKRSLLLRIKKVWRKLEQLRFELKLGMSGAALALFLSVADSQAQIGPFVEKPRSENPLRPPLLGRDMRPAASDVDNDGDVDVLVGFPDGTVRFFRNDGTPTKPSFNWISGMENPFDAIASGSSITIAFADIDEDGDEDLVLVDYNSASTFWRKDGPNSFTPVTGPGNPVDGVLAGGLGPQITFADVDGDSDLDLVAGFEYYPGEYLKIFEKDGPGYITTNTTLNGLALTSGSPNAPAFADVDGDGDLDLFLGETVGFSDTYISFFRQDAAGDFLQETGASNPFDGIPFGDYAAPVFIDLDNDGDLDAIVGRNFKYFGSHDHSLAYLENKFSETGVFEFEEKTELENPFDGILGGRLYDINREVSFDFLDIDEDGNIDVLLGSKYGGDLRYYRFDPSKDLHVQRTGADNPFDGISFFSEVTPRFVDYDSDDQVELIVGDANDNRLFTYNGNEVFTEETGLNITDDIFAFTNKYAVFDADGDGDKDVLIGTQGLGTRFFRNNSGSYSEETATAPIPFNTSATLWGVNRIKPSVADINHDGLDDIIAGVQDGTVRIFLNTGVISAGSYQYEEMVDAGNPVASIDVGDEASPILTDIDEDGDLDLFIGNFNGEIIFVKNENPPPAISISTDPVLTFEAGDPPLLLDPGVSLDITDDDTDAIGAIVRISGNFVSGQDVLGFTLVGDITAPGGFNSSTGEIRFAGSGSMDQYQQVLQSITYQNISSTPTASTRIITYYVFDHDATDPRLDTQPDGFVTVNVQAAIIPNDPPVLAGTITSTTFIGTAIPIENTLTLTDADDEITSATIQISSGYVNGEDQLVFTNQNGISGTFDAATGILSLTGVTTVANYQAALRSIQYNNTAANRTNANRTVTFTVNDGTVNSNTLSITVAVPNQAPALTSTTASVTFAGTDLVLDNALTITDADDTNLSSATVQISAGYANGQDQLVFTNQSGITGTFNASTGVLALSGAATVAQYQTALRSVLYRNVAANRTNANRTVTFTVNDGTVNSNTLALTLQVPNVAPTLTLSVPTANYAGGDLVVDAEIVLADEDDTNFTAATVSFQSGYVAGEDELVFTNQAGISGSFNSTTGVLTLTGASSLASYQAALRTIVYRNTSGNRSAGNREIAFVVNDGQAASTSAVVLVVVPNNAPALASTTDTGFYLSGELVINNSITITDGDNTTLQGATVRITAGLQTSEDVLVFTNQNGITGTYAAGTLTLAGSASLANYQAALRSVQYRNNAASPNVASRTITFAVTDGTNTSNSVTTVLSINRPPVVSANPQTTIAGGNVAFSVASILSDPDDNLDLSTLEVVSAEGATVTISGGQIVIDYSNVDDFQGTDVLTITVCDVAGRCSTQSIDIELDADIQVYNGVSPNGDGANDYFKIRYLPTGSRVSVYNRWGDLVFSENNYDNTDRNRRFEGLNDNGNELASGTYFYKIETPQGRTLTGYLTLKR